MDMLWEWQKSNASKPQVKLGFREYGELCELVGTCAVVMDHSLRSRYEEMLDMLDTLGER